MVDVNRTSTNAISQRNTTAAYGSTTNRQAGYDPAGRVKTQLQLAASTAHRYGYDGLGRLLADSTVSVTGAQCPPFSDDGFVCSSWTYQGHVSYSFDAASNRTDEGASYLAGSNQIRAFAGRTYLTDVDGNVTSETYAGNTTSYEWDARNRLSRVIRPVNTYDVRYDAQGRLARIDTAGVATKYFLWDGDDLLAELNASGAIVLEYSYYPGMDNLHAVKKGSTVYYAHVDLQGNVIALTTGSTVGRTYEYVAWGSYPGLGGTDPAGFAGTDRARWKGALFFGEFGGLYYMRARWYDPIQGRFLSEDPIGLAGGINPYVFAGDDPINGRDPTGLDEQCYVLLTIYYANGVAVGYDVTPLGCDSDDAGGGGGGVSSDGMGCHTIRDPQRPCALRALTESEWWLTWDTAEAIQHHPDRIGRP